MNRIKFIKSVCYHTSYESAGAEGQGACRERPQDRPLVALEADGGFLPGRAVDPLIGDLDLPRRQVTLQAGEGIERSAGQCVVLDVADAAFDLPLGPRTTGTAGLGDQSASAAE